MSEEINETDRGTRESETSQAGNKKHIDCQSEEANERWSKEEERREGGGGETPAVWAAGKETARGSGIQSNAVKVSLQ